MSRTALVTGTNQGLGFALVKALSEKLDPTDTIYLAARSEERGRAALEGLGVLYSVLWSRCYSHTPAM